MWARNLLPMRGYLVTSLPHAASYSCRVYTVWSRYQIFRTRKELAYMVIIIRQNEIKPSNMKGC